MSCAGASAAKTAASRAKVLAAEAAVKGHEASRLAKAYYSSEYEKFLPGQQKRAKFPTSKAHISAVFHSFRLIFGRAIISRNGLEAWMLFPERARAEHSR